MRDRPVYHLAFGLIAAGCLAAAFHGALASPPRSSFQLAIPRTWDDAAMAALEVPLADPIGSPKHVPASYYYKIPVRPIYKIYAVYAPGHEPPGYMDWLKQQEPQIVLGLRTEVRGQARAAAQDENGLDQGRRDGVRRPDKVPILARLVFSPEGTGPSLVG